MTKTTALGSLVLMSFVITACGGGGGGSGSSGTSNPPPAQGTITGTAVKGPVSGANVVAYRISGGATGARIASATTDASGNFSLAMGSYAGSVMLQVTGGTYTDEATPGPDDTMPMMAGDMMTAVLPAMSAGATVSGIQVTPLTSMAQAMAQHLSGGMTDANINAANTAVGNYFMVSDIVHTGPMNPLVSGSGASQDAINYGMTLAAMSQYANDLHMDSSSAMVTAMMNDASDGTMDGMMSGSQVMMGGMNMSMPMASSAGTTGLATAMQAFIASPQNHSGVAVATVSSLINQLDGSSGQMGSGTGSVVNGTMTGKAFNGTMSRGTVTAYAINNGAPGAQIASTAMDSSGAFSMSLGSYGGSVMLQVTGGSYADEATGSPMTMASSDVMTAVMSTIASGANVSGIALTPLTSMAQARAQAMTGGMTDANINAANTAMGNYFMVSDILHTACMDPSVTGSGNAATQDQRDCGAAIAAMSQYAKEQGMTMSFAFVTDMMDDASDGTMNGMMGSTQIQMGGGMMGGGMGGMMQSTAGTSGLATAMTDFMGSTMNRSGLTAADMNALIQKLSSSSGQL